MATHRTPAGVRAGILSFVMVTALAIGGGSSLVAGCGSDTEAPAPTDEAGTEGSTTPPTSAPSDDGQVPPPPPPPPVDAGPDACADASPDADIDCTGLCGPVTDKCTGKTKECGGCTADPDGGTTRVCDLTTNTCIKPKITCADLGAECGTVKDSCGDYLDCPDTNPKGCAAGKECDPDTHKCVDCQNVTCNDLGFQCGFAWLGCGQDTQSNYTDCGGCAADPDGGAPRTCNDVFHICEPKCTPPSAATLCAAAKAKLGVECGIITDGCGGTVNCDTVAGFGCPSGQSCGVRGIANRCDPKETPDECKAAGIQCGDITSACTGKKIHCGDCATNLVCNSNGVCGAPCTPKTCADFTAFQCGTFDDGCGGTVKCGTCTSGICNEATKTCCNVNTCSTTYSGKCGTSLPNGCGTSAINCPCAAGQTCTTDGMASPPPAAGTAGMCCTPKTSSSYTSAGQCGTNLPDGCGKNDVSASCPGGQDCVNNATGSPGPAPTPGTVGTCCVRTDSCNLASGTCGVIQDSCRPAGTTYTCNKCVAPSTCLNNACCTPAPACTGNGFVGGECNVTKNPVDPGCGSSRTCSCSLGLSCWCTDHVCTAADGAGVCKQPLSCSSGAYFGHCGTGLDNGVGGTISCGCPTGQVCSTSTAGALGTCKCNNPTGAPYNCSNVPGGPGTAGGDQCGTFSNGCGGALTCSCGAGQTCNTTPNPNVCCTPTSCPAPAVGSQCGSIPNGCGGANSCGCPAGDVCNTSASPSVCCAPTTCPAPALGSACGVLTNGCGGSINCGCPSGPANANYTCTAGHCACTPDTCRGRTGPQPDLCGGTLNCGG